MPHETLDEAEAHIYSRKQPLVQRGAFRDWCWPSPGWLVLLGPTLITSRKKQVHSAPGPGGLPTPL